MKEKENEMSSTTAKCVRFPKELAQEVTEWSARKGQSFSEFVREAVDAALADLDPSDE